MENPYYFAGLSRLLSKVRRAPAVESSATIRHPHARRGQHPADHASGKDSLTPARGVDTHQELHAAAFEHKFRPPRMAPWDQMRSALA